jgi:hypothetical protein
MHFLGFIEPKEGDKFHFNGQDHTLGHHLGKGSTASAHTIAGDHHEEHKHIIAKVFHTDKPKDRESEIENLKKVNEYHGEAKTEHGHPIILASKKEGVHITKTNAWNNAKTKDEKGKLLKHAQTLVADRNTHHANKHGLIHTCVGFIFSFFNRRISLVTSEIIMTAMCSSKRTNTVILPKPTL